MLVRFFQPPAPAGGFLQAIVLANGDFESPPDLSTHLAAADLIIAADGGAQYARTLGLRPDVIIGDFDSLDMTALTNWQAKGVRIISHPVEKDQTDLELALVHAKQQGAEKIVVLGAFGRRLDHSIANLLLAVHPQFVGCEIVFLHGAQRLLILKSDYRLPASVGEPVSLLPLGGDVTGVATHGLKYELMNDTLFFGSSRGVSNVVLEENPRLEMKTGVLLCVISPSNE